MVVLLLCFLLLQSAAHPVPVHWLLTSGGASHVGVHTGEIFLIEKFMKKYAVRVL
jgi:hypothetical protein